MLTVLTDGDPKLELVSKPATIEQIRRGDFRELTRGMHNILKTAPGIGLAAPQVGVMIRFIVTEDTEDRMKHLSAERRREINRHPVGFKALFNPEIIGESIETRTYFESCLSYPGIIGAVTRPYWILVSALNENGEQIIFEAEGWEARSICHEIDHLDGINFIDRALFNSIMPIDQFLENDQARTAASDELVVLYAA